MFNSFSALFISTNVHRHRSSCRFCLYSQGNWVKNVTWYSVLPFCPVALGTPCQTHVQGRDLRCVCQDHLTHLIHSPFDVTLSSIIRYRALLGLYTPPLHGSSIERSAVVFARSKTASYIVICFSHWEFIERSLALLSLGDLCFRSIGAGPFQSLAGVGLRRLCSFEALRPAYFVTDSRVIIRLVVATNSVRYSATDATGYFWSHWALRLKPIRVLSYSKYWRWWVPRT